MPAPNEGGCPICEPDWCCGEMRTHTTHQCELHEWWECPDVVVHRFINSNGEVWYGLPIHDDGASAIAIDFCPWCGKGLDDR